MAELNKLCGTHIGTLGEKLSFQPPCRCVRGPQPACGSTGVASWHIWRTPDCVAVTNFSGFRLVWLLSWLLLMEKMTQSIIFRFPQATSAIHFHSSDLSCSPFQKSNTVCGKSPPALFYVHVMNIVIKCKFICTLLIFRFFIWEEGWKTPFKKNEILKPSFLFLKKKNGLGKNY